MLLLLQPLWVYSPVWVEAEENKDDRLTQAVQNEASLSPAATRAGFLTVPRPQVGNAHGSHIVAATIRPPEVRRTAITRERLCWDDHTDNKFESRSEEISRLLANTVCSKIY